MSTHTRFTIRRTVTLDVVVPTKQPWEALKQEAMNKATRYLIDNERVPGVRFRSAEDTFIDDHEPIKDPGAALDPQHAVLEGFGYAGVFSRDYWREHPMLTYYTRVLATEFTPTEDRPMVGPLRFLEVECGEGRAVALYHATLSTCSETPFTVSRSYDRPKVGPAALWDFVRLSQATLTSDVRTALTELFGGVGTEWPGSPPAWFLLAGRIR